MNRSLGLNLDARRSEPYYQQIFDQIVQRIQSGALPAGSRLPPTRALASELNTHRNTVVRAFEELNGAGWLEAVVGRGTFVRARQAAPPNAAPASAGALPWASLLSRGASAEALGRSERLSVGLTQRPCVNLQRMQPPPELLAMDELRRCTDHALRTQGHRAYSYAPTEGIARLRRLVAEELSRSGVPARAEDVIITSGSQQALDLVFRALVDPGDTVLVERCTYHGALTSLAAAGAHAVGVPTDGEGPELAALRRHASARALYLMPDANNPTGGWLSQARREALIAWSREAGVPLIEDDYAADLDLDGTPLPPALRALDGDVIYITSFSKKLVPALRLGAMVCPPALRPRLLALKYAMDLCSSAMLQYALAEFLERGYLRTHLKRALPVYRARRDALTEALAIHLPEGLTVKTSRRGLAVWLPLPPPIDPREVFIEAQRRGVLVTPGTISTVSPDEPSGLRLTFCSEPPERLVEGARRLGEALRAVLARPIQTRAPLEGP